ncbi:hypothetical protein MW887_011577 [Aspergillus wentii]|nr:hypothetical protein MW887_011577 [Aspergillus wentii]
MSKTPAAPPPPGVTPNFDNPDGSEYEIYSISIALCSTATVVLLLRLYTRVAILRGLSSDDLCCVMGQICAWIFAILSILNIKNGYGVHIWDLYADKLKPFKQYDLAEEGIYALGVWFVKTSILLFYLRLSPEKRFRQMTFAIMAFVAVYSILSIFLFTFGCNPIAAQWDMTLMDHATCIDQLAFVYANAVFNVVSDVVTLVLPIRLCWSLQTRFRQKLLLMIVLVMGSFACIVSCVRIITMMPFLQSTDFTWFKVTLAKWCMVEINVGIICSCLPIMRPLLIQTFPRLFSTVDRSDGQQPSDEHNNGYPVDRPARRFRNWDHLTTLKTETTTTTAVDESERDFEGDEKSRAIAKSEEDHHLGIVKSTDYSITYKDPK